MPVRKRTRRSPPVFRATRWSVIAFWGGASLLFTGGGLAYLFKFAGILLRARWVWQSLSVAQVGWLFGGLFFLGCGLSGIILALLLAGRRSLGYYGSLLFGLMMTVLAPGANLILPQPHYLATVCAGLLPATIVLLTLVSMADLDRGGR